MITYDGDERRLNREVRPGQEFRLLAFDKKTKCYRIISLEKHHNDTFKSDGYGTVVVKQYQYQAKAGYVFEAGTDYPAWAEDRVVEAYKWAAFVCIEKRRLPIWWLKLVDHSCGYEEHPNQTPEQSKRAKKTIDSMVCSYRKKSKRKDKLQQDDDYYDTETILNQAWCGWHEKSNELKYYI